MLDMQTTNRWFFVVMMGRSAGHLALGAGKAAGAPITLIPEEFPNPPIAIDDVVRTLEGAIVKRLARGRPDGVAVIAEGVASAMDPNDPLLADAPRDEHGHVRLAEVPLARVLRTAVADVARGARRQGDDRREGRRLRAALRLSHRVRSRLHARPRRRRGRRAARGRTRAC